MIWGEGCLDHFAVAEADGAGAALFGVNQEEASAGVDDVVSVGVEVGLGLLEDGAPVCRGCGEEVDVWRRAGCFESGLEDFVWCGF